MEFPHPEVYHLISLTINHNYDRLTHTLHLSCMVKHTPSYLRQNDYFWGGALHFQYEHSLPLVLYFSIFLCFNLIYLSFTVFKRLLSSQVFSVGSKTGCNNFADLVKSQRVLCSQYPKLMVKVGIGAGKALKECQRQFAHRRWNCSVSDGNSPILGKLMNKGITYKFSF